MFTHITLNWALGDFARQFKHAKEIASLTGLKVSFEFNGVKVNITGRSTADRTYELYREALSAGSKSIFGEGWR